MYLALYALVGIQKRGFSEKSKSFRKYPNIASHFDVDSNGGLTADKVSYTKGFKFILLPWKRALFKQTNYKSYYSKLKRQEN